MRTLAHLSDLHFGTEDPAVCAGLIADLAALRPSLVVVSGDLTQRAKVPEFIAARDFLARLPHPQLVVPGNHDVPLYDVVRRFAAPLRRYRAYISSDLQPFWRDDELAVLGICTARSWTWKRGRINAQQMAGIHERMVGLPDGGFKIVVTHHQFIPPEGGVFEHMVGRAGRAVRALEDCSIDLLLAGHLHVGFTGDVKTHYETIQRSILVAQAGTATSRRRRGEPNAYNVITIDGMALTIAVRAWDGSRFAQVSATAFEKRSGQWRRAT
ncbi:MAG: metallophosphoesterase [Planctomycetes bacterium]|nr:metallophosphoesterase [Planctomycetota bacterium]